MRVKYAARLLQLQPHMNELSVCERACLHERVFVCACFLKVRMRMNEQFCHFCEYHKKWFNRGIVTDAP